MQTLSRVQKVAYTSSAFSKGMLWNVTDFILLYFIAEIQGIGAENAGYILLASLIWSGFLDIALSIIFDKKSANYQKVILYSSPFCLLSFSLLFIPLSLPYFSLIVYYVTTTFLFRLGYSLVDIPHNAMLSTITKDSHVRTQLSAYRIFFNSIAVLLFAMFVGQILGLMESDEDHLKYLLIATSASVMLINIVLSILPLWSVVPTHTTPVLSATLKTSVIALCKNQPFLVLLLFTLVTEALVASFYRSGVYFSTLLLGSEKHATGLIVGLATGKILALPLFVYIARHIEKNQLISLTCIGQLVCFCLFYIFTPDSVMVASFLFFLCGIFLGGLHMIIWSALPDTIEYGKYYTGVANQALTFGVFHLVMRVGSGISFVLIGVMLSGINYQTGADNQVANDLVLFTTVLAGIGSVGGLLLMRFYTITRASHADMSAKLSLSSRP